MKLVIDNMTGGYGGPAIITGLNHVFPEGLSFVTGGNGSGKSTLLRICADVLRPYSGNVQVTGAARENDSVQFAYVPHRNIHYSKLTGFQQLCFFGKIYGLSASDVLEKARFYIESMDMQSFINARTDTYSRGQLQRLCLLQSLINEPDVFLIDEPLSSIDPESKPKLIRLLQEYASAKPRIVIASSHEHTTLNTLAGRIFFLRNDASGITRLEEKIVTEP